MCKISWCQISNVEYGKNRVQFHDDFESWYRYETAHFVIHWYGKARNNSDFVVKLVEHDFDELERVLEHHINDKIEILVFSDLTDLKQSNIGLDDAFINTDNRTKVTGRKIFVYFDGGHGHLRRQIREGIAEVYLYDMISGGNLQQLVKNAISYDLPEWYVDGIISYLGQKWDPDKEVDFIHLWRNYKHKKFDDLLIANPRIAGNLMWYYIAQQYGHGAISNLLYVSRINRDLDDNFTYILGQSLKGIKEAAYQFASSNIVNTLNGEVYIDKDQIKIKNNKKGRIVNVRYSPDGKNLIYVINDIGKVRVYKMNIASGKSTLLFKNGYRNIFQATDYNYPVLTWHPDGRSFYIVYEHRDIIYLKWINIETGQEIEEPLATQYRRVYSIDYMDEDRLLINGSVNGLNNFFVYLPKTRESRTINDDFYDDRDGRYGYLKGEYGILYSSNRPDEKPADSKIDTILPIGKSDIFFMSLPSKEIHQLTNTPGASERKPIFVDSVTIAFQTDATGISNRAVAEVDRVFTHNNKVIELNDGTVHRIHPDSILINVLPSDILHTSYDPVYKWIASARYVTDLSQTLVDWDINSTSGQTVAIIGIDKEDYVFMSNYPQLRDFNPSPRWYKSSIGVPTAIQKKATKNLQGYLVDTIVENVPAGLLFKSEFPDPEINNRSIEEDIKSIDNTLDPISIEDKKIERINFSRILGSRLTFHVHDVDFKFDNELLFDGLQNYASSDNGDIINQPFGVLLKLQVKDLLEDYSAEVGVRYPTDFRGSEYFLVVDDNKKRIDKRYAAYRRTNSEVVRILRDQVEEKEKQVTHIFLTRWKYPFDTYRSLRATFTFRTDDQFLLNTEPLSLAADNNLSQRFGLKLEYVFDNSLQQDYNIIHGSRYKIFGEVVNKTEIAILDEWRFKPANGFMAILGIDARHYQRIDRRSVLAVRLAGSTSFGTEKILYYLGGVENWLFPSRNEIIPIPGGDEFVYQGLGVQMRGFNQNIRNGNSYALINTELRVPIFQYLKKYNLRSAFLRNFIITGFFDVGTAWQGASPFGDDNPLNTITVSNARTSLRINFFRDPIVYGYGAGARVYLFGYNLKFDYGWGVDSGERQNGVFYFSIGRDF